MSQKSTAVEPCWGCCSNKVRGGCRGCCLGHHKNAGIVQWIRREIPTLETKVRFLVPANLSSQCLR